jgi:hypothetical protein
MRHPLPRTNEWLRFNFFTPGNFRRKRQTILCVTNFKVSEKTPTPIVPSEAMNPSVFTAKIKRDPLRKIGAL